MARRPSVLVLSPDLLLPPHEVVLPSWPAEVRGLTARASTKSVGAEPEPLGYHLRLLPVSPSSDRL